MTIRTVEPAPTPTDDRPAPPAAATPAGNRPRYRWWHAVAVGVAVNIPGILTGGGGADDREFYASLPTPRLAPPGWLFVPVWTVNNTLTLWGNLRIANLPEDTPGRRAVLASEAATWVLYAAFSPLYIGRRSPALGAADTVAGLATTTHAVARAATIDPRAAWALAPRLAWLTLASYVSVVTAVRHARGERRRA
ncbi:MAG: tryptophan-rich sensory protein [Actinomycetospora sp.]|nr:tryptophan-rich sensory protein [Actinomycetospora sp.]